MARKSRLAIIPKNLAEANIALFRLGETHRSIEEIENEFVSEVAALRKLADEAITPLAEEAKGLVLGLEVFADTNRSTLLVGDEKTVKLSGGSFGWRFTPYKVSTGKGGDAKALATVKSLNLKQYIRTTESLDKDALLRDKPVISGIRYTQKENFFADPEPSVDDPDASVNVVKLVVNS